MTAEALQSIVDRARTQLEDATDPTERTVQLRVIEPVLSTLGWDLRSSAVVADQPVGDGRLDYALTVEDDPAIVVESCRPGADVEAAAVRPVAQALEETTVNWGIASDGRAFVLLTTTTGELERLTLDLADLPDRADALEAYTSEATRDRHTATRTAAKRLRADRSAAVDAVTEALLEITDGAGSQHVHRAAGEFVDELVDRLGDPAGSPDRKTANGTPPDPAATEPSRDDARSNHQAASAEDAEHSPGDGSESAEAVAGSRAGTTDEGNAAEDAPAGDGDASDDRPVASEAGRSEDDASGADTEYIARFFSGTSSIGAVGNDRPGGTLAGVIEYLSDRHGIDRQLTLPWGVGDGPPLLTHEPPADGACKELSTGAFVRTDVDEETALQAIDRLAEQTGLRVMLQGDW